MSSVEELIAVLEGAEASCRAEYEHRAASCVWGRTAEPWKHKAAGIRYALDTVRALLALP